MENGKRETNKDKKYPKTYGEARSETYFAQA
jgi:hypothetical protein